jgi:DMSO/TMAO reductase YedYZ molybdopterin-dependent catalytic subunit
MIIRSAQPQVIEFPFSELQELLTPTEKFYVRDHFPQPNLSRDNWRLRVEGAVSRAVEFRYDEILAMPARTVIVTLECAGNGRSFLTPPAHGVQWDLGGVGTAEWTGVPLATVLRKAGLRTSACDVILEGADEGEVEHNGAPAPEGKIHFARSLPLDKALDEDVLLAYRMNGQELTVSHGFPLRVIVPGWYAVASVKWLSRIIVSDHQFNGFFQTIDYGYWEDEAGETVRVPIRKLKVKAAIARPEAHERVRVDSDYDIFGACWSGESLVDRVEITTDDGNHWESAELIGEPLRNAWRLWRYKWHTPATPGSTILRARATDQNGDVQPMHSNPQYGDYMINWCLPMEIELYL